MSMTYSSTCQGDVSIIKTPFPCQPHPVYIFVGGDSKISSSFVDVVVGICWSNVETFAFIYIKVHLPF